MPSGRANPDSDSCILHFTHKKFNEFHKTFTHFTRKYLKRIDERLTILQFKFDLKSLKILLMLSLSVIDD